MELELEVSEVEDYSEFPASETVEQRSLCYSCKRRTTSIGECVKKEDKATQNSLQKSVEKEEKKIIRLATN